MVSEEQPTPWWDRLLGGSGALVVAVLIALAGPDAVSVSDGWVLPALAAVVALGGLLLIGSAVRAFRRRRPVVVDLWSAPKPPRSRLQWVVKVGQVLFFIGLGCIGLIVLGAIVSDSSEMSWLDDPVVSNVIAEICLVAVAFILFVPLLNLVLAIRSLLLSLSASIPLLKLFFLPLDEAPAGQPVVTLSPRQQAALRAASAEDAEAIERSLAVVRAALLAAKAGYHGYAHPWWRRPLMIVARGYVSAVVFFLVWWVYAALDRHRLLSTAAGQLSTTFVLVAVVVFALILFPFLWAIAPLFMPLTRVRRTDSPLRFFWARCLLTAAYGAILGPLAASTVALLFTSRVWWVWVEFFMDIAAFWLVVMGVGAVVGAVLWVARRRSRSVAIAPSRRGVYRPGRGG